MRPFLFLAMTLLPDIAVADGPGASGVSLFTLPNGLQGVVIEDHRAPVVTQMVWYRVGAADEPPGQSGIAHFLEHLMFKGTESRGEGEFSRIVAENGGDENAFTSYDYTAYFQRIAADRLDLVMGMEADRMANLAPDPDGVISERGVVLEERRQRVENTPGGSFDEQLQALAYLNHPYRHPIIGWRQEIEGFSRDAALAFYRTHYGPNNAILVVAGDVDPAEVERLAERHYGPIPPVPVPPRIRPQEPDAVGARRLVVGDERVRQPRLERLYPASHRKPGDQAEAAALTLLAELMGSGITSTLSRELELGQGIAVRTGAHYSGVGVDAQAFSIDVVPKPGVSLEAAEAALDALLARTLAEPPDPAALERIKTRLRASEIYQRDSQQGRARRYGAALAAGLSVEDIEAWPAILQAVTPADVQAAARAVFRPETAVTGWLTPKTATEGPTQ